MTDTVLYIIIPCWFLVFCDKTTATKGEKRGAVHYRHNYDPRWHGFTLRRRVLDRIQGGKKRFLARHSLPCCRRSHVRQFWPHHNERWHI